MIDELIAQKIKDAANIVEVIGDFYELRKDGLQYTCLCPFHDDHHLGSFKISPRRNKYKCFSQRCEAGGNCVDFLIAHEGISYPEALTWLAKKYSIDIPEDENTRKFTFSRQVKKCKPHQPLPELPMLVLDQERFMFPTLGRETTFTKWLASLPWSDEQRERLPKVLKNYLVGGSKNDQVIFWQMDEQARLRTGKLMQYEPDGHRSKWPDGRAKGMNQIHSMLEKAGIIDPEKADRKLCLYGLHLLELFQPEQVNLVESEKTALICATVYGNHSKNLWMALGGAKYLKREFIQPLIDRGVRIVLYPDMDSIDEWQKKAKEIGYKHLTIADRWMKDNWRPEDGEKADVADILIRLMTPKIDEVLAQYPQLQPLHDKFGLELISIKHNDKERD